MTTTADMFRNVGIGLVGVLTGSTAANLFMLLVLWSIPDSAWVPPESGPSAETHEPRNMPAQLFANPSEAQPEGSRAAEVSGASPRTEISPDPDTAPTPRRRRRDESNRRSEVPSEQPTPESLPRAAAEGSTFNAPGPSVSAEDRSLAGRVRREVWRDDEGLYHIPRMLADEVARDRSLVRSLVRRVAPYESPEGTPLGIQLLGVGGLLSRIGLRDEDVLLSVNGIPLDAPQRGAAAARALRESTSITLVVYRNSREVALRYALE